MAVHFIGSVGSYGREAFQSAVRLWGPPDVYHYRWDTAQRQQSYQPAVADGDTVVFVYKTATSNSVLTNAMEARDKYPYSTINIGFPDLPRCRAFFERIKKRLANRCINVFFAQQSTTSLWVGAEDKWLELTP